MWASWQLRTWYAQCSTTAITQSLSKHWGSCMGTQDLTGARRVELLEGRTTACRATTVQHHRPFFLCYACLRRARTGYRRRFIHHWHAPAVALSKHLDYVHIDYLATDFEPLSAPPFARFRPSRSRLTSARTGRAPRLIR